MAPFFGKAVKCSKAGGKAREIRGWRFEARGWGCKRITKLNKIEVFPQPLASDLQPPF